tara:strand:- start:11983 stop:13362 length:1380 start_codon:yes stop_codon:yes gene_type:complete
MGFDWGTFAGSFLEELTEGIEEREQEAKDYKQEQKQKAERNLERVRTSDARAQQIAQIGRQAMQLGATKEQVIAAMSSGAGGVQDFYTKLTQIAADNNLQAGQELTQEDIETGIALTGIPSIDPKYITMTLDQIARQTYGAARPQKPVVTDPTPTPQTGGIRDLFGFNERAKVDRELEEEGFYGDMSIADINFLAQQSEYKSLVPNATMTFADIPNFNSDAKFEFGQDLIAAQVDGLKAREDEINAAKSLALQGQYIVNGVALSGPEAEAHATMAIRLEQADFLIRKAAEDYTPTGFFDDQSVKAMIIRTMNQEGGGDDDTTGLEYYNDLKAEFLPDLEEEEPIESDPEADPEANENNQNQEETTPLTAAEEAALLTKKRVQENVYYRDDEGNVVKGVPPRPTLGLGNILGGAGLGGEDIEEIYKGNAPVPERLRPNQWDELFGAIANPDGSFKQLKGE